jgi:hypothetical protein
MTTLAQRLEAWEPAPLGHPLARVVARLWAAPLSAAGLAVGLVGGAPVKVHAGVLLFAPVRGVVGAVMRRRGFSGAALGHVVLCVDAEPSPQLLRHELVHTRQTERLGLLMAPLYLGMLARYGYRRHPLELAAYRIAAAGSTS